MAGGTATKATTGSTTKVPKPTVYFSFVEHDDVKDLETKTLKIKQIEKFAPPEKDEEAVTLEIWEMKSTEAGTKEKSSALLLKIIGKVSKADDWNFRVETLEQDATKYEKPANGKGTKLWLPAKLEIVGTDDKKRGLGESNASELEFVLPPLEYDETLELQFGSTLPNSAVGQGKVTWGTFEKMLGSTPTDKSAGVFAGAKQISLGGNLRTVVVHCMCAINTVGDEPTKSFDVDKNVQIFKDNSPLGAHFIIDRNGGIFKTVDHHNKANHAGGDNTNLKNRANTQSIGIEMLGFADNFREQVEKKYADEAKNKLKADRDVIADALEKRKQQKADGIVKVTVGGKEITIDEAIKRCEDAIADLDSKIASTALSKWAEDYEKLIADKRSDGVPKAFAYTDAQYASLGKLAEVCGKRYGYELVCTHHWIRPDGKTDPGIYFDWSNLTPYLLPGSLSGNESGTGGSYTVS